MVLCTGINAQKISVDTEKQQKIPKSWKFEFGRFFNVVRMLQKTAIKDKYP